MGESYICPHCGAYAGMERTGYSVDLNYGSYVLNGGYENRAVFADNTGKAVNNNRVLSIVTCRSCLEIQIWLNNKMVYPYTADLPFPNDDMPKDVKELYNEARSVFSVSPKSSAALLRLGLQKLCKSLGGKGENINDDIKTLVEKGLSVEIQQALDTIRIVGNNSVHPGEINVNENKEFAGALFTLLNLIVERMITEPRKIKELYGRLPESSIRAIEKRDGHTT